MSFIDSTQYRELFQIRQFTIIHLQKYLKFQMVTKLSTLNKTKFLTYAKLLSIQVH